MCGRARAVCCAADMSGSGKAPRAQKEGVEGGGPGPGWARSTGPAVGGSRAGSRQGRHRSSSSSSSYAAAERNRGGLKAVVVNNECLCVFQPRARSSRQRRDQKETRTTKEIDAWVNGQRGFCHTHTHTRTRNANNPSAAAVRSRSQGEREKKSTQREARGKKRQRREQEARSNQKKRCKHEPPQPDGEIDESPIFSL